MAATKTTMTAQVTKRFLETVRHLQMIQFGMRRLQNENAQATLGVSILG
jgi:hypothetical protein